VLATSEYAAPVLYIPVQCGFESWDWSGPSPTREAFGHYFGRAGNQTHEVERDVWERENIAGQSVELLVHRKRVALEVDQQQMLLRF